MRIDCFFFQKKKNMEIEFILTFKSKQQEFLTCPFENGILKDKQSLFDFASSYISDADKKQLVKISSCVLTCGGDFELPSWYAECKGKIFIENGVLM